MDEPTFAEQLVTPPGKEDALWELFHENSKISLYQESVLSQEEILKELQRLYECLPYEGYPIIKLPKPVSSLQAPLSDVLDRRQSARDFVSTAISLNQLGTLLHYAYGIRQRNEDFPRSFRFTPSGGGLFPLELYLYSHSLEGQHAGLYHYNPLHHHLSLLRKGHQEALLSESMIQGDIVVQASVVVFLTAIFERSIFKYGDRGYRFILMESGHVAQNLNLVSGALGLGCLNIGGFFDRKVDAFLGLDGVTHSTLYLVALGQSSPTTGSS